MFKQSLEGMVQKIKHGKIGCSWARYSYILKTGFSNTFQQTHHLPDFPLSFKKCKMKVDFYNIFTVTVSMVAND